MIELIKNKILKSKIFKLLIVSLAGLACSLLSLQLQAKTLVLVHGFLSGDMYWRSSGFSKPLQAAGWVDAGSYNFDPRGMLIPRGINLKKDIFITVNLPSEANLQIQEGILLQYMQHLYMIRKEPISLIGHSAGGVVARLYVIDPAHVPVKALITIASPHLGTPTANIAYLAEKTPLGMMASIVGEDTLSNARGLLSDLKEEAPGNFLHWMNHQPHPNIQYVSIIRKNDSITKPAKFDYIVPPFSQNMNNVWALRGASGVAYSNESHALNGNDGLIVLNVLNSIYKK